MVTGIIAYFIYDWVWIKNLIANDTGGQSFVAALIGALVGGTVSGIGSFFGGTEGAKKNFELQAKHEEYLATQRLYNGLVASYEQIEIFMSLEGSIDSSMLGKLIFDPDWQQELALVQGLSGEEVRLIIDWYMVLAQIEVSSPNFQRKIDKNTIADMFKARFERMSGVFIVLGKRLKELKS